MGKENKIIINLWKNKNSFLLLEALSKENP